MTTSGGGLALVRALCGRSVAAAAAGPHNNFTLVRLLLALAVVVSHSFSVVSGAVDAEPLHASTGYTLGEHAVNGFFVVSGFLVTMSFDRRGWKDYTLARLLRIAPGLIAATLAVAILLGLAFTRLAPLAYLTDPKTWNFVFVTLTSFKSNTALPGVFEDNPFRFPMGTVWTLKYEVICYAGVFVFGLLGLLRSRLFAVVLVVALILASLALDWGNPDAAKGVQTAVRLPLLFALGGAMYRLADELPLTLPILVALGVATVLADGTFAYRTLLFIASAYGILWVSLVPVSDKLPEPASDLSYGTYLYGWPIQQGLHAAWPALGGLALLAPSIILSLGVAALSWHFVERPALRLKSRLIGGRARPREGQVAEPAVSVPAEAP